MARLLSQQDDFANQTLEELIRKAGHECIFLPKFHCELNPIEQCWGYAKRKYQILPPSPTEADLEKNVVQVLDNVDVITMQR